MNFRVRESASRTRSPAGGIRVAAGRRAAGKCGWPEPTRAGAWIRRQARMTDDGKHPGGEVRSCGATAGAVACSAWPKRGCRSQS